MKRLLITGFGPFPGAPSNPTQRIARRLGRLRLPGIMDIARDVVLLETTHAAVAALPGLIARTGADGVLMFGLAGRRRHVTPEARGLNYASVLRHDAAGRTFPHRALQLRGPAARASGVDAARLAAAMRQAGAPARVSHDAGDYLCNAALYTALGTGVPALFVHVPRARRIGRPKRLSRWPKPSRAAIDSAAAAALAAMARAVSRR